MIYTMNEDTGEVSSRQPNGDEIKEMIKHRSERIKRETAVVKHDSERTDIENVTPDDDSQLPD